MALIKDWFQKWMDRHVSKCPSAGWKEVTPAATLTLFRKFIELKVSEAEADVATDLLFEENLYPLAHFARILEVIQETRSKRVAATRDEAIAGSANCPACQGNGKVAVSWTKGTRLHDSRGPQTWVIWCYLDCPLAKRDREALGPEFRSRIHLWSDYVAGSISLVPSGDVVSPALIRQVRGEIA